MLWLWHTEDITNENKNLMQILTKEKEKFQGELESLISELSQYRNLSEQLKSEYQQNLESFTENLNIELRKLQREKGNKKGIWIGLITAK